MNYTNPTQANYTIWLFIFIVSIFVAFIVPWWFTLILAAFMIIWHKRYEMVFLGLLLDLFYVPPDTFIFESVMPQTVLLLLCVPLSWLMKQYIREDKYISHA